MTPRATHLSAATALVAAVPVAVWGLLGRQDVDGFSASELDYAYRPLDISDGTAAVIGVIALLLAGVGGALLVRATRQGELDRRWWEVLAPLMVAGVIVGVGWRVLTAGVLGVNIGAGLTMLFGGPVVAGLSIWALVRGVRLATRRPGGHFRPGQQIELAPRGA
ncbi:hypothetical protein [Streptomyces xylophagus]|uniref:hypothetical protein n=1 Tax=Streptomyces xylophagus TaxID=285514 RepID=UPI000AC1BA31|nr:hypothetical protein [Streptomyces xylophagus]